MFYIVFYIQLFGVVHGVDRDLAFYSVCTSLFLHALTEKKTDPR